MCATNRVDIFSSFLDIRQNVEWPRFLAHPVYRPSMQTITLCALVFPQLSILVLGRGCEPPV